MGLGQAGGCGMLGWLRQPLPLCAACSSACHQNPRCDRRLISGYRGDIVVIVVVVMVVAVGRLWRVSFEGVRSSFLH